VVAVAGDHSLRDGLDALEAAVREWLELILEAVQGRAAVGVR
jgi:hypothetical protein